MGGSMDSILELAKQFGPLGLLIAFLMYKDRADRAATDKLDATKGVERARQSEARLAQDRERLEADKALAAALAALTAVIQGWRR